MVNETSEKEYKRFLSYIEKRGIDYTNITDILEYISKIKDFRKDDGTLMSQSSTKIYFVSTIWYIKNNGNNLDHIKQLKVEIEAITKAVDKEVQSHQLINNQKENYLDWESILAVYESLKQNYKKCLTSHLTFVLVSCYILMCPRRLGDYSMMRIKDDEIDLEQTSNYYIKMGSYFVFNKYKTSKHYKTQRIKLCDKLTELVIEYLNKYNVTDYLFNLSPKAIQSRLIRTFAKSTNKSISVNILRHSYISWAKSTNKILGQENSVALQMGHSVEMQNDYYKDNTLNINENIYNVTNSDFILEPIILE